MILHELLKSKLGDACEAYFQRSLRLEKVYKPPDIFFWDPSVFKRLSSQ
jgi:hypothetical protein